MRALTLPQPHASLVAAGVQTIVTLPRATDWRGDLLIHAGSGWAPGWLRWMHPDDDRLNVIDSVGGTSHEDINGSGWYRPWLRSLPLGAVVAVARVTDCAPIVDEDEGLRSDNDRLWVSIDASRGPRLWSRDLCYMVLGRQLPYADFTPGRWALLLDDVRPLLVESVKGRPGVWTPDDDLTDRINKEKTP